MLKFLCFFFLSIFILVCCKSYTHTYTHYVISFENLPPKIQVFIIFYLTSCRCEQTLECLQALRELAQTSTQLRALVKATAETQAKKLGTCLFYYVKAHELEYCVSTVLRYAQRFTCLPQVTKAFARALKYDVYKMYGTSNFIRDLNTQLFCTLTQGDKVLARFLLEAGASVCACTQNAEQKTVLMLACEHADVNLANFLLKNNAWVNACDIWGNTALMVVAGNPAKFNLVQLLLSYNADVNVQNSTGITALMAAASTKNNIPIIRLLLNNGARVNTQNIHGCTALIFSAALGACDTVRLLLAYGAHIHTKANDGTTALVQAKRQNQQAVVGLLQAVHKHKQRHHKQQLCLTQ